MIFHQANVKDLCLNLSECSNALVFMTAEEAEKITRLSHLLSWITDQVNRLVDRDGVKVRAISFSPDLEKMFIDLVADADPELFSAIIRFGISVLKHRGLLGFNYHVLEPDERRQLFSRPGKVLMIYYLEEANDGKGQG